LHHARQKSGFGQTEVSWFLVEEKLRGFGETMNTVGRLSAQKNLIGVCGKYLLFGPLPFQMDWSCRAF
jgi:hypothetical protein